MSLINIFPALLPPRMPCCSTNNLCWPGMAPLTRSILKADFYPVIPDSQLTSFIGWVYLCFRAQCGCFVASSLRAFLTLPFIIRSAALLHPETLPLAALTTRYWKYLFMSLILACKLKNRACMLWFLVSLAVISVWRRAGLNKCLCNEWMNMLEKLPSDI